MNSKLTKEVLDQYCPFPAPTPEDNERNRLLRELIVCAVENAEAETEQRAIAAAAWLCRHHKRQNGHCFAHGRQCDQKCEFITRFQMNLNFFMNNGRGVRDELVEKVHQTNAKIAQAMQIVQKGVKSADTKEIQDKAPGSWSERENE